MRHLPRAHAKPAQRGLGELSRLDGRCFRFLHSRLRHEHREETSASGERRLIGKMTRGRGKFGYANSPNCQNGLKSMPGNTRNPIRRDWVNSCDCRLWGECGSHAANWPSFTLPLLCRQPVWRRLNRLESRLFLAECDGSEPPAWPS
jgi:hypothetical protein